MASAPIAVGDICLKCGARLSPSEAHCPTCRTDVGAPNVRRCRTDENLKALVGRLEDSRSQANASGCSREFSNLETVIKEKSGVVVSMPAAMARSLFDEPSSIYVNYEHLVGTGVRIPRDFDNDSHRCAVGGVLFGSYANSIVYGALSLTDSGLPTYGPAFCRLRSVAIDARTSFLETNSYRFIPDHSIRVGDRLPPGSPVKV